MGAELRHGKTSQTRFHMYVMFKGIKSPLLTLALSLHPLYDSIGKGEAIVYDLCISFSMIPKLHDLATQELAIRAGGAKTGLLNASLVSAGFTGLSCIDFSPKSNTCVYNDLVIYLNLPLQLASR